MNDNQSNTTTNHILLSLPDEDRSRVMGKLERVKLVNGQILCTPDESIKHVYFPEMSMISVVAYTEDGQGAEVAVIGSEGVVGVEVVLGEDKAANELMTQMPDGAYRMTTSDVRAEFALGGAMQKLLLQFTHKLIIQISQTALCNRMHTTERRLSRWLLMCHDRADSDKLELTQEFLALMLGTTRTSVSVTARELQKSGFISYARGRITIVDRSGLEEYTCACYQTIAHAYGANAG